jgi:hypothetical protein
MAVIGLNKLRSALEDWLRNRNEALSEDEQIQELEAMLMEVLCLTICHPPKSIAEYNGISLWAGKPCGSAAEEAGGMESDVHTLYDPQKRIFRSNTDYL